MGVGKSTIAKKLSENLHIAYVDLDHEIEKQQNKTINEIFVDKGEIFFRKQEHQLLQSFLQSNDRLIISVGGGTPCYANNHLVLQEPNVASFYLKASIATLTNRLENEKEHRPLLNTNTDDTLETYIAKHLFDRSYFYYQAKHIINVDNKSIYAIVEEIITILSA